MAENLAVIEILEPLADSPARRSTVHLHHRPDWPSAERKRRIGGSLTNLWAPSYSDGGQPPPNDDCRFKPMGRISMAKVLVKARVAYPDELLNTLHAQAAL